MENAFFFIYRWYVNICISRLSLVANKKSRVHFPAFCFDQVTSSSHLPRSKAGLLWFCIGLVGFCTFFGLPENFYLDDTQHAWCLLLVSHLLISDRGSSPLPTNEPFFWAHSPRTMPSPARAPSTSPNILHQTWQYKWKQYRSDHIHSKDSFHPFRSCFAPFFDILKIGSDKFKGNVTRLEYSSLKMYANKQNMTESWQVTKKNTRYICVSWALLHDVQVKSMPGWIF